MFDPFIEPIDVNQVRLRNDGLLMNNVSISMYPDDSEKSKWYFHAMGITNKERIRNVNQKGW
jgi:hypothetical protein